MIAEKCKPFFALFPQSHGANCLCHLHVIATHCSRHVCLCVIASSMLAYQLVWPLHMISALFV